LALPGKLVAKSAPARLHVDPALFEAAWAYFERHLDKSYSFTDCVSFIVLTNLGISTALAFDKHFLQAGFRTEP
jgi:predicted nucleic acid-binding protein